MIINNSSSHSAHAKVHEPLPIQVEAHTMHQRGDSCKEHHEADEMVVTDHPPLLELHSSAATQLVGFPCTGISQITIMQGIPQLNQPDASHQLQDAATFEERVVATHNLSKA